MTDSDWRSKYAPSPDLALYDTEEDYLKYGDAFVSISYPEELGRAMARAYQQEVEKFKAVPLSHQLPGRELPQGTARWEVTCKQDPRFNMQGVTYGLIGASAAMDKAIREKAKELGLSDEALDALTIEVGAWKD